VFRERDGITFRELDKVRCNAKIAGALRIRKSSFYLSLPSYPGVWQGGASRSSPTHAGPQGLRSRGCAGPVRGHWSGSPGVAVPPGVDGGGSRRGGRVGRGGGSGGCGEAAGGGEQGLRWWERGAGAPRPHTRRWGVCVCPWGLRRCATWWRGGGITQVAVGCAFGCYLSSLEFLTEADGGPCFGRSLCYMCIVVGAAEGEGFQDGLGGGGAWLYLTRSS
jgi:hypothetical protein